MPKNFIQTGTTPNRKALLKRVNTYISFLKSIGITEFDKEYVRDRAYLISFWDSKGGEMYNMMSQQKA